MGDSWIYVVEPAGWWRWSVKVTPHRGATFIMLPIVDTVVWGTKARALRWTQARIAREIRYRQRQAERTHRGEFTRG